MNGGAYDGTIKPCLADLFEVLNGCHTTTVVQRAVIGTSQFFQGSPVDTLTCPDSADIEQDTPIEIPAAGRCKYFGRCFPAGYDPVVFDIDTQKSAMVA
jgi:hypothetical protein